MDLFERTALPRERECLSKICPTNRPLKVKTPWILPEIDIWVSLCRAGVDAQGADGPLRARRPPQHPVCHSIRIHLTQCIHWLVLESQLPIKTVNLIFQLVIVSTKLMIWCTSSIWWTSSSAMTPATCGLPFHSIQAQPFGSIWADILTWIKSI